MKFPENIASVRIAGEYVPLSKGITVIGKLKFHLELENKADNLYSWLISLENDSNDHSPRIQEFLGLDMTLRAEGDAQLNTLRGDDCTIYSYYPESFDLADGVTVSRRPTGGRSSNTTAFPYFDIEDETGAGFVCGIGWSGQRQ